MRFRSDSDEVTATLGDFHPLVGGFIPRSAVRTLPVCYWGRTAGILGELVRHLLCIDGRKACLWLPLAAIKKGRGEALRYTTPTAKFQSVDEVSDHSLSVAVPIRLFYNGLRSDGQLVCGLSLSLPLLCPRSTLYSVVCVFGQYTIPRIRHR